VTGGVALINPGLAGNFPWINGTLDALDQGGNFFEAFLQGGLAQWSAVGPMGFIPMNEIPLPIDLQGFRQEVITTVTTVGTGLANDQDLEDIGVNLTASLVNGQITQTATDSIQDGVDWVEEQFPETFGGESNALGTPEGSFINDALGTVTNEDSGEGSAPETVELIPQDDPKLEGGSGGWNGVFDTTSSEPDATGPALPAADVPAVPSPATDESASTTALDQALDDYAGEGSADLDLPDFSFDVGPESWEEDLFGFEDQTTTAIPPGIPSSTPVPEPVPPPIGWADPDSGWSLHWADAGNQARNDWDFFIKYSNSALAKTHDFLANAVTDAVSDPVGFTTGLVMTGMETGAGMALDGWAATGLPGSGWAQEKLDGIRADLFGPTVSLLHQYEDAYDRGDYDQAAEIAGELAGPMYGGAILAHGLAAGTSVVTESGLVGRITSTMPDDFSSVLGNESGSLPGGRRPLPGQFVDERTLEPSTANPADPPVVSVDESIASLGEDSAFASVPAPRTGEVFWRTF
jgi:hypothetical protein